VETESLVIARERKRDTTWRLEEGGNKRHRKEEMSRTWDASEESGRKRRARGTRKDSKGRRKSGVDLKINPHRQASVI